MVMFNEANICNILETILFGSSACEALDDSVIDLVDYVLRHLTQLCSGDIKPYSPNGGGSNLKEDLEHWRPGDKLPDVPIESLEEELNRLQEEVTFQVGTYRLPYHYYYYLAYVSSPVSIHMCTATEKVYLMSRFAFFFILYDFEIIYFYIKLNGLEVCRHSFDFVLPFF